MPVQNGNNPLRLDRNESMYFARELEAIKTRTYDAKVKELKALRLIPINTTAGNAVTQITFRRYTGVGIAQIIANYAKDFSRVDVYGEEDSVKVIPIGVGYGYSIEEIRQSIMSGKNLDARKAAAARRAVDQKVNDLALFCNAREGTRGLIDYPGITEVTLPADGTGGAKFWNTKDVDQILRDINIITNGIMIPTHGVEVPDTLLVPLEIYNLLANTRLGDNVTTLLKYIYDNNPHIKRIEWLIELAHAGAGGSGRMICGQFDEEHITLEIPQPFEQFPEQLEGMEYTIPCHCKTAGVIMYYPMAFCYADMAC